MFSWKPPTNRTHTFGHPPPPQEQLRPPRHLSSTVSPAWLWKDAAVGLTPSASLSPSLSEPQTLRARTPAVLFIRPVTSWAINTKAYNNVIYGGVHINIDLCAVTAADLPSAWIAGGVALADGLIENQSARANRQPLSNGGRFTPGNRRETSPKLQKRGSTGPVNK